MSHNAIDFFSKFIEKETGIIYQDSNLYQLKNRLEEIVKNENLASIDELANKFQGTEINISLKQKLLDHATNNETIFFRDPNYFTAIENFILTEVLLEFPSEIKIWSAAASTGQEALSIAMTLDELSSKVGLPPYSIIATDISERAISKAKSGLYTDFEMKRGLSPERRNKYFIQKDDSWQVKKQLHSKIEFKCNNLLRPTVLGTFHIILCRNVLIYQKIENKKIVIERLLNKLEPNGGLLLGVGETMLGIKDKVESQMIGNVVFYKKTKY
jgi:chemotaxis protein methyltransferase CheR